MENPMLDFEMEHLERQNKAFNDGYEKGKKDAEFYLTHCANTDEPFTNADRIRAMTDEELASEMSDVFNEHCLRCPVLKADCHGWEKRNSRCYDAMLDWLKQECE